MTNHVILNDNEPYKIDFVLTPSGDAPGKDFMMSLPDRPRIKVSSWIARLKELGPNLPRPYADVVAGEIRELRVSFARLEIRLLYFIHRKMIVITNGFLKKTPRLPPAEIARAERLRARWLSAQEDIR